MFRFDKILLAACFAIATTVLFSTAAWAVVFTDDAETLGLWHMETIGIFNNGLEDLPFVADDNSTGRDAHALLLGTRPLLPSSTDPTSTPGAPGMGNALLFDGVDDSAFGPNVWADSVDHVSIDFMMRPEGLPDLIIDNFMGTVNVLPVQTYLQDDGSGNNTGNLATLAFYDGGANFAFGVSQGGLALGEWHDVHVEVTGTGGANGFGVLSLTVNGVTNTVDMEASLGDFPSQAVIGKQTTANARYFNGALDEIRIATAPAISTGTPGDFDTDGDVDGEDFLLWQRNQGVGNLVDWQINFGSGSTLAAVASVPEPASAMLALLGLGVLSVTQFRRRK